MIESHRSLEEMSPSDYDVLPKMHVSSDMQTFDRNTFLTERALCHHITSRGPGTFEANLQLPVIIGEVPESERELFSNLPIPELESPAPWMVGSTKEFSFLEIADLLPGTTELIKNDLGLLGVSFDSVVGRNISFNVDRMPVEFQAAARSWHIDGVDAGFKPVFDMFYLICDNNPTIAFEGPASLDVRASPVKGK